MFPMQVTVNNILSIVNLQCYCVGWHRHCSSPCSFVRVLVWSSCCTLIYTISACNSDAQIHYAMFILFTVDILRRVCSAF